MTQNESTATTGDQHPDGRETDAGADTTPRATRRRLLATATTAGLAGCLGFGGDGGGTTTDGRDSPAGTATSSTATTPTATATTPTPAQTAAVRVSLQRSSNGVQKFAFVVEHDDVPVADVAAGAVDGQEFQIADGEVGDRRVRLRGADLSESVQGGSEPIPLFTVAFRQPVAVDTISVTAETLTDDDGSSLTDAWTVEPTSPPE